MKQTKTELIVWQIWLKNELTPPIKVARDVQRVLEAFLDLIESVLEKGEYS